ncbi:ATP-binding protein [Lactiplantibacillus daowaiensis]|uniref:AAA family ATPase n=1 Tax=Lactiplantibacillus daowaiensis TaxID=2559918 RepID=A0ABW1RZC4_9LACO|nr:AAA family ATPase [Lactiplantibacillus daowaiensis]
MQIRRIEIAGFGKFQQQSWDLSAGLQVIYGANESGKSTLRAFILGMLFGFPTRRHLLARYEPKTTSQYGGSLDLVVDDVTYRLTRLGDQPATLVNLTTNAPQPLSLLDHWLQPYDEDRYKQLFTFNQAELTALKNLSAADLNTQLQQIGTLDSRQWRTTATDLRQSADAIYKPRGRKPELNQALQRYQQLKAQVATAQQRYPDYQALQAKLATLNDQQLVQARQLATATATQQQLANLRRQWPVYQQIQQLKAQSATAMTAITPAVRTQYEQLTTKRTELRHTLASARAQLSAQPVDAQSKTSVGFYVAHQAEFDQLEPQLPALQQALGQYQTLTAQVQAAKADYQAQQAAHPELLPLLAPSKQSALANLKAAVMTTATTSRQQQQQPAAQLTRDWRLIAGGIGVVAGVVLPLGALKWVLILAGLGLLGWFGWEQLAGGTTAATDQTLAPLLTAVGFSPDLDQATILQRLEQVAALQRAQQTVTTAEQQVAAQAATVWQQLQVYQFANDWLNLTEGDLLGSGQRVTAFYTQVHQAMQTQTLASSDFAYVQRQVQQLTQQLQTTTDQLQQLAASQGLADIDALATALAQQTDQAAAQATIAQLSQRLTADEQQALAQYATVDDLQAAIQTNRDQVTQLQQAATQQAQALAATQTTLQAMTTDGRYTELRQQQANAQTELTVLARQWVTRQLGATWIDQTLAQLTNQQLPAILTVASANFAQLTGQRYNEIKLNQNDLTVQMVAGPQFSVGELSTATREQLYLALRLALIAKLGDRAQLPLMIDDGLVNFDTTRRAQAWQLLSQVATHHQLLYFTNEPAALTDLPAAAIHHLA